MLRRLVMAVGGLFLLVLVLGLAVAPEEAAAPPAPVDPAAFVPPPAGPSWEPAPVVHGALTTLAEPAGERLALHTVSGDVTFWTGVNLGSTTPGHSPGELAISREDYRRWFEQMGRLGVRVLRIYTIHQPHMYEELLAYNTSHPQAPLFLMQGVHLPDESYTATRDLYAAGPTRAFTNELRAASDAVHGRLVRPQAVGRAGGAFTADVSRWLAAWIIGVEWDPYAIRDSDRRHAAAPEVAGRYFASVADSTPTTPTERWLAARMDELATAEADKGSSAPIAFVNWPTTDPLRHALESVYGGEDVVGVDANHVRPTAAWPGGTFASFHAYPYFPEFMRNAPGYQDHVVRGGKDPYAGYLSALDAHVRGMPLMITELGVPSSVGSAHRGTAGRDQGDHSEQEALATDAALVRVVSDLGLAGAMLFSWADEWFKFTWNTVPRHRVADPERRAVWHDPLTNEQWFGLNAEDPLPVGRRVIAEARTGVQQVAVDHDASFLHLEVQLDKAPTGPVRLGFDVMPDGLALPGGGGGTGSDVAVVVDPVRRTATASIRGDLDPVQLDGLPPASVPAPGPDGWSLQRMSTNRPYQLEGGLQAAEFLDVGVLREGVWDIRSPEADSRSTWQLEGGLLRLRLPWSMLALGDPSSHVGVRPARRPSGRRAGAAGRAAGRRGFRRQRHRHRPVGPLERRWAPGAAQARHPATGRRLGGAERAAVGRASRLSGAPAGRAAT